MGDVRTATVLAVAAVDLSRSMARIHKKNKTITKSKSTNTVPGVLVVEFGKGACFTPTECVRKVMNMIMWYHCHSQIILWCLPYRPLQYNYMLLLLGRCRFVLLLYLLDHPRDDLVLDPFQHFAVILQQLVPRGVRDKVPLHGSTTAICIAIRTRRLRRLVDNK